LRKRLLRRIFGPKREEVTGGQIRLLDEELHNLYTSPNTFRVTKSRRMRWTGYVARTEEMKMRTGFWMENLKERDNSEDPGIDRKIILAWILGKYGGKLSGFI
jgi:hypothetical protein